MMTVFSTTILMDQSLLPPSQTRITSFSVDSRFADQYYHGTSDFLIRLPSKMQNVMRIALCSVELPEVAYVFSAAAGNLAFTVISGGVTHSGAIPAGNYHGPGLALAVKAAIVAAGVASATCSYDISSNRFSFGPGPGPAYSLLLWDTSNNEINSRSRFWGLGYNMGVRTLPPLPIYVASAYTVSESPQFDVPAYTLLQIRCPDMMENTLHRTASGSYVQALAKLILRSGKYQYQFDDGGNLLRKENVFKQPTSITQLRISLVDAYGNLVAMGDTDWSMTFEIMEVISSCEYAALNAAYGRC